MRVKNLTATASGAGAVDIDLKPDDGGVFWRILWAIGTHISGGARTLGFYYTTPEDGECIIRAASRADNEEFALCGDAIGTAWGQIGEMWSTYTRYPTLRLTATGAGDDVYARVVLIEYQGMEASQ